MPNTSICPAGWQLPVNGTETTNKSFAKLLSSTYGYGIATGTTLLENPYLGITKYYGLWDWYYMSENYQGSHDYFWYGIPSSETNAYHPDYWSSGINIQYSGVKGVGLTIRCVQR